uniref:Uncharacterized protein n=1 Tax=Marseillevirus sp. TaxID=2809551 RepID=A0AA96ELA0_9VIRU|nr:hypothetical protein MarFTMF_213 [Marseillevirus sp.]
MSANSVQLIATKSGNFWNLSVLQGTKRQKNAVVYIKSNNYVHLAEELGGYLQYSELCRSGALDKVSGDFLEHCTKILLKKNKKDIKVLKRAIETLEFLPESNVRDETLESLKKMKKFLKLDCSVSIIKAKVRSEEEI